MVDDGPWLYYKLTNEPKGGELKKGLMPTDPKNSRKKRGKKKTSPTYQPSYKIRMKSLTRLLLFFRPDEYP